MNNIYITDNRHILALNGQIMKECCCEDEPIESCDRCLSDYTHILLTRLYKWNTSQQEEYGCWWDEIIQLYDPLSGYHPECACLERIDPTEDVVDPCGLMGGGEKFEYCGEYFMTVGGVINAYPLYFYKYVDPYGYTWVWEAVGRGYEGYGCLGESLGPPDECAGECCDCPNKDTGCLLCGNCGWVARDWDFDACGEQVATSIPDICLYFNSASYETEEPITDFSYCHRQYIAHLNAYIYYYIKTDPITDESNLVAIITDEDLVGYAITLPPDIWDCLPECSSSSSSSSSSESSSSSSSSSSEI